MSLASGEAPRAPLRFARPAVRPSYRGMRMEGNRRFVDVMLAWAFVVGTVGAVLAVGATAGRADPCNNGRASDAALTQTSAQDLSGNTVYTLTVTNFGPACLPGAQVRVDLSGDYLGFVPVNPSSWSC